jgi:DNA-binding MarR family transcriptional regulator
MTSDSTIEALRRASRAIESHMFAEARSLQLTPRMLTVLLALAEEKAGLAPIEIQDRTGFDKSTALYALNKLEALGLVRPAKADKARKHHKMRPNELTPAGRNLVNEARAVHEKLNDELHQLLKVKAGSFHAALEKIVNAFAVDRAPA